MSTAGNRVKTPIVVLEEHPLLRHGITDYLNSQPDMLVCGESDNIRSARDEIARCKPQLLVTALRLGAGDSLEFVKALKAEQPALLILVYSAFEETIFAERALRAGADGYVMKSAPKEELLAALREILNGNIYVSRDVAMRAFKKSLEERPEQRSTSHRSGVERLSDREMHIFQLLGSGLRNQQIARSFPWSRRQSGDGKCIRSQRNSRSSHSSSYGSSCPSSRKPMAAWKTPFGECEAESRPSMQKRTSIECLRRRMSNVTCWGSGRICSADNAAPVIRPSPGP